MIKILSYLAFICLTISSSASALVLCQNKTSLVVYSRSSVCTSSEILLNSKNVPSFIGPIGLTGPAGPKGDKGDIGPSGGVTRCPSDMTFISGDGFLGTGISSMCISTKPVYDISSNTASTSTNAIRPNAIASCAIRHRELCTLTQRKLAQTSPIPDITIAPSGEWVIDSTGVTNENGLTGTSIGILDQNFELDFSRDAKAALQFRCCLR